jgi:intermediate cleaving peptidase 55
LTGWNEEDSLAVIQKTGNEWDDYVFRLFCRPKDPAAEQWMGPRNGVQAARDIFNADEADDISDVDSLLPGIIKSASKVFTDLDKPKEDTGGKGKLWKFIKGETSWFPSLHVPLYPLMNTLRAIKSEAEIANMRKAGQISGRVITNAMRQKWTREKDLHAYLDYNFTTAGCDGPAYIPVVAGGRNALMIHYVLNNMALNDSDMVLVDAGGEYGTYVTDISRTWPVAGKFTPAQRDLYEAVLKVQRTSISLCRESSNLSLDDIHEITENGLYDQLKLLGFGMPRSQMNGLFPHHVGHYVGLDVHDVPGYGRKVPLKAGHCITVEPGVYIPDDNRWPKHFRGMGIRIEDSVCVDDDSPLILTTEAVKEVVDIESLRN